MVPRQKYKVLIKLDPRIMRDAILGYIISFSHEIHTKLVASNRTRTGKLP